MICNFVISLLISDPKIDLVIEAVTEKLELKRRLFGELDSVAPANTIFATNTSFLLVKDVCGGLRSDRC